MTTVTNNSNRVHAINHPWFVMFKCWMCVLMSKCATRTFGNSEDPTRIKIEMARGLFRNEIIEFVRSNVEVHGAPTSYRVGALHEDSHVWAEVDFQDGYMKRWEAQIKVTR